MNFFYSIANVIGIPLLFLMCCAIYFCHVEPTRKKIKTVLSIAGAYMFGSTLMYWCV